jgi:hypothetical protein
MKRRNFFKSSMLAAAGGTAVTRAGGLNQPEENFPETKGLSKYATEFIVPAKSEDNPVVKNNVSPLKSGGREGIRTPGLLVANRGENKLRQGATIT